MCVKIVIQIFLWLENRIFHAFSKDTKAKSHCVHIGVSHNGSAFVESNLCYLILQMGTFLFEQIFVGIDDFKQAFVQR